MCVSAPGSPIGAGAGETLPEHTHGAGLFADISGFTPLTEALDRALSPRRGAETLTRQLNQIYDALGFEVDRYGGSVIGFAGDSINCWLDDGAVWSWEITRRNWFPRTI